MRVVADTNIIVSGLLNPYGAPGQVVIMGTSGELEFCYDGRIIAEYREVLERPKFNFDLEDINSFIHQIELAGHAVAPKPLSKPLPDPDDAPFLEAALAGRATCIITGNSRHYPSSARQGTQVLGPSQFLSKYYS